MLKRTLAARVPHPVNCSALIHWRFTPTVCMPMPAERKGKGRSRHTLVLDIDNTLIDACESFDKVTHRAKHPAGFSDVADLVKAYDESDDAPAIASIDRASYFTFWTRPYLQEFMAEVSELFEVVFWTAGTSSYMAAIINALERQVIADIPQVNNTTSFLYDAPKVLAHLAPCGGSVDKANKMLTKASKSKHFMNYYGYSRHQTLGSNRLKHIPLLGLPGDNVIMMDDATRSFVYTPRSAILVDPYYYRGDKEDKDTFLKDVMPMLRCVAKAPNAAREMDHWRDARYVRHDNLGNNKQSYLNAHPRSHHEKGDVHIGSFLPNRLADGDAAVIPPAKLFGLQQSDEVAIAKEVADLQKEYTTTQIRFQ